jgi:hypothetical protein
MSTEYYLKVSGGALRRELGDATGGMRVSEKNSSRKPSEQARLRTPRYRIPMRVYASGFPRMPLLRLSKK